MGIERFFNSISQQYQIVTNITFPYQKINTQKLFFDFNSIIHTVNKNNNVIENVKKQLLFILTNNFFPNIKLLYIGLDGVPSKSKMIEQRHRRYMGEYFNIMKKKITGESEKWSKNNISPGTKFMHQLSLELKSKSFYQKIKTIQPSLETFIISDIYETGEAEMKIFKYIHNYDDIVIYSPDADVILLSLLLPNNVTILRHDQQESEHHDYPAYNIINIEQLKESIYQYVQNKITIDRKKLIKDIVFIFTIFGDDFLPKIESYDVKNDIDLILNKYIYVKTNCQEYLINNNLNKKFFIKLLKVLAEEEESILLRNYYRNNFKNYDYLLNTINEYITTHNTNFIFVNQSNFMTFIKKYNLSRELDVINQNLKQGKNIFISYSMANFLSKNINIIEFCDKINISIDKCFLNLQNNYKKYYQITNKFPKINMYLQFSTKLGSKIKLINIKHSIENKKHQKYIKGLDEDDRELYKLNKLLDDYRNKYQVTNFNLVEEKDKFYQEFFDNKIKAVQEYIKGLYWILDYYFHNTLHLNWIYPYHKSPLIKDIFEIIVKYPKIMQIQFDKIDIFFTPIEQFLYISPINYIDLALGNDKLKKFIEFAKNDNKLSSFFIDLEKITEHDIDCRGVRFLNKCWIKNMHDIDTNYFITQIRKFISLEEQQKLFNLVKFNNNKL